MRAETRAGGTVWSYVLWLFVLDGFAYPALVWWRRSPEGRRAILGYARQRWPLAVLGGSASIGASTGTMRTSTSPATTAAAQITRVPPAVSITRSGTSTTRATSCSSRRT